LITTAASTTTTTTKKKKKNSSSSSINNSKNKNSNTNSIPKRLSHSLQQHSVIRQAWHVGSSIKLRSQLKVSKSSTEQT
jgi:hypothetical protein